ncbi:MAG: matrix protein [Taraxacum cytorhabdovirus 1]|uniref:Matrix protein n=1 Tax=Taraxacum cytorhabdovirus 1 TaxID=2950880 RepID=A0AAE9MR07_9RHAB|nr:MAG: matrix protein [Taraxacum cytorhabdovirus 1]
MSVWVQIKFESVQWFTEKLSRSKSLEVDPIEKTNAIAVGFLSSKLDGDKKPIGELLSCMVKSSRITMVNTIGRSKFLGPGCKKCSFLLPKSIVIPTDLNIPVGVTDIPLMSQEIKVSGDRYYMTMGMRIRAAVMSAKDADLLYGIKPKEFIGYIDCISIPEGTLSKPSGSGKGKDNPKSN